MIRIYKDKDNKYVTKGAYEMFYKPLGYNIIIENVKPRKTEEPKEETKVQLDGEVRVTRRTRGSSNKKNEEGEPNALSNQE